MSKIEELQARIAELEDEVSGPSKPSRRERRLQKKLERLQVKQEVAAQPNWKARRLTKKKLNLEAKLAKVREKLAEALE